MPEKKGSIRDKVRKLREKNAAEASSCNAVDTVEATASAATTDDAKAQAVDKSVATTEQTLEEVKQQISAEAKGVDDLSRGTYVAQAQEEEGKEGRRMDESGEEAASQHSLPVASAGYSGRSAVANQDDTEEVEETESARNSGKSARNEDDAAKKDEYTEAGGPSEDADRIEEQNTRESEEAGRTTQEVVQEVVQDDATRKNHPQQRADSEPGSADVSGTMSSAEEHALNTVRKDEEAMSQQKSPEKGRGEEVLHAAGGSEPGCAGAQEDAPHHKPMSEQERLKLWREQHNDEGGATHSRNTDTSSRQPLRGYDNGNGEDGRRGQGREVRGLEVWVSEHRVEGRTMVYEISVRVEELGNSFEWVVDKTWKEIVSLREALEAASMEDTQERAEAGAGRSNVKLPKLPQHRSVAAALSVVARAQTPQTRALAQETSTFLKLVLLAIKGTALLGIVTDWLEAPAHLQLQASGQAGPLQRGAAGRYRILLPDAGQARASLLACGGSRLSPLGHAWGVALAKHQHAWVVEKEDEVLSRMQALQVSLGRVRSGLREAVSGTPVEETVLSCSMWFEVAVSCGSKSALRPWPASDEALLGLPHQWLTLHLLGFQDPGVGGVCGDSKAASQAPHSAAAKSRLVCHGSVCLAELLAPYGDTAKDLNVPLFDARTQHPASALIEGDEGGERGRRGGEEDRGGARGLQAVGKVLQRLTLRGSGEGEADKDGGAGWDWWSVGVTEDAVAEMLIAVAQQSEQPRGAQACTHVVYEARGCWWESEVCAEAAGVVLDEDEAVPLMRMGVGADGRREVRVRLPWERKQVGSIDVRLVHTRRQAEKHALQCQRAADAKACVPLYRLVCLPSPPDYALPHRFAFAHALMVSVAAGCGDGRGVVQALVRCVLRAGNEVALVREVLGAEAQQQVQESGKAARRHGAKGVMREGGQGRGWDIAKQVAVEVMLVKGGVLVREVLAGLVEEVCAAGRDLDIEPACVPPPHATGLEVLAAEEARQDKCELLAEVVVRFFDAVRQLLQDYLAQLSQPPPAPLAAAAGTSSECGEAWRFLAQVREVLRHVEGQSACESVEGRRGAADDEEFGGWVGEDGRGCGVRGANCADEGTSDADEGTSDVFMAFVAAAIGMCARDAETAGARERSAEEEESLRLGLRTVFWVQNAFQLAGDGIKKVVWGALEERRGELRQLVRAILDAAHTEGEAHKTRARGGAALHGASGVSGCIDEVWRDMDEAAMSDVVQVSSGMRANWHPFCKALTALAADNSVAGCASAEAQGGVHATGLEGGVRALREGVVEVQLRGRATRLRRLLREMAAAKIQRAVREWQYVFVASLPAVSRSRRICDGDGVSGAVEAEEVEAEEEAAVEAEEEAAVGASCEYQMIPDAALVRLWLTAEDAEGGSSRRGTGTGAAGQWKRKYLLAPSSYDEIIRRGWVREGMLEEPGAGVGGAGEGIVGAGAGGARDDVEGVRKGRVVPATDTRGCVVLWEEMRLSGAWSGAGVLQVQRNGDSSLTLRVASGLPVAAIARAAGGGGAAQQRVYLDYDMDCGLFAIRSGSRHLCLHRTHPDCVEMTEVAAGGRPSLWWVEVLHPAVLGLPCKHMLGLSVRPSGRQLMAEFAEPLSPPRVVLRARLGEDTQA